MNVEVVEPAQIVLEVIDEETLLAFPVERIITVEIGLVGPQGPPGGIGPPGPISSPTKESPIGSIDGANATFLTSASFVNGSTQVYLNGLLQYDPDDYAESGTDAITFTGPPEPGDTLLIIYVPEA